MRVTTMSLLAAGILVLGGCSSTPTGQELPPAVAGPEIAAAPDDSQMTGSRIPNRKSSDRMLKSVGAQEARDAMDSAPRPLNSQ